jgi:hypothetical protein
MRRIVSRQLQAAGAPVQMDGFFDRVIKYIPSDIVAGWVALNGLSKDLQAGLLWGLLAVIALFTFLWTKRQTTVPGQPPATKQCVVATISFLVWAFALHSGPFATLTYDDRLGSIGLIVYTLGIGLIVP